MFLWQLPQTVLGAILCRIVRARRVAGKDGVWQTKRNLGISLGRYIIVPDYAVRQASREIIRHELGHRAQSERLGWLYLVVIGLPSLSGNIFDQIFHKSWSTAKRISWYYGLPWEAGADKLGGVRRE